MAETTLARTPLHDRHAALGARIVPFAGWEMPVQYAGILAEHEAVRRRVGLFDVSHMGEFEVTGPDALAFVNRMTTNDVASLAPGGVQYTTMLRPLGGIVDDLLVYRLDGRVLLVVNAANTAKDLAWLLENAPRGVRIADRSREIALLALQGPRAAKTFEAAGAGAFLALRYYTAAEGRFAGVPALVSRTGYTGEDGFEIYVEWDRAGEAWDRLAAAGAPFGLAPAGLGARDSLRLEARYCLYGNDIDETTNPLEAGLGWIVKLEKGDFVGREALARVREAGPARRLVGFVAEGRDIPRHGYPLRVAGAVAGGGHAGGAPAGTVTSGGFGPSLGKGIGMGYVPAAAASPGTSVEIDCRGRWARATIVKGPFYSRQGTRSA